MIRKAPRNNDFSKQSMAYLVDRIRIKEGKKQLYGTQMEYVDGELVMAPVSRPYHLDKRRIKMELEPYNVDANSPMWRSWLKGNKKIKEPPEYCISTSAENLSLDDKITIFLGIFARKKKFDYDYHPD